MVNAFDAELNRSSTAPTIIRRPRATDEAKAARMRLIATGVYRATDEERAAAFI
jgi:hypothetical protein